MMDVLGSGIETVEMRGSSEVLQFIRSGDEICMGYLVCLEARISTKDETRSTPFHSTLCISTHSMPLHFPTNHTLLTLILSAAPPSAP